MRLKNEDVTPARPTGVTSPEAPAPITPAREHSVRFHYSVGEKKRHRVNIRTNENKLLFVTGGVGFDSRSQAEAAVSLLFKGHEDHLNTVRQECASLRRGWNTEIKRHGETLARKQSELRTERSFVWLAMTVGIALGVAATAFAQFLFRVGGV